MSKKKRLYTIKRTVYEFYEVTAESKKAALDMPKDNPYAVIVKNETATKSE